MSKNIIITGGGRGIGAAAARLCGERGWSVAINYAANDAAAKATVGDVERAGGKAIALKGHVADERDVIALFDAAAKAFGPIDGVVNNAGTLSVASPLADMTLERIRQTIEVNLLGSLLVAREAARRLSKSRGGRGGALVNLSSAAAKLGGPGEFVDYAASKGGVEAMNLGLSKELGKEGVRVNAVRPGLIDTEMQAMTGDAGRARRLAPMIPMGRPGTADEVAQAIVWLLSDDAAYVSGAVLDVTGGR
jgi:NAD(P)-dependent dehydrogenase (short-subunit alcohol dehydrogenase family)